MTTQQYIRVEFRFAGDPSSVVEVTKSVDEMVWLDSYLRGGLSWGIRLHAHGPWWSRKLVGLDDFEMRLSGPFSAATDWLPARLDGSSTAASDNYSLIELRGGDARLVMSQKVRTRAWPSRQMSSVVAEIGEEYGLEVDVEDSSGESDWWQCRETDWSFIRKLARESITPAGRGGYFVYVCGNTMKFTTPSWEADPFRVYDILGGAVRRAVVRYNGRKVDRLGGARTRGIGYDLHNKVGMVFEAGGSDSAASYPALSSRVPRDPSSGLRVIPVIHDEVEMVRGVASGKWASASHRYFSLRLDVDPDLYLRPGIIISLSGPNTSGQPQLLGKYLVMEVRHVQFDKGLQTTVVAYRREADIGQTEPSGVSVSQSKQGCKLASVPGRKVAEVLV